MEGERVVHKCLRTQWQEGLEAAGRVGDGVRAARFAGQLDALRVIVALPEDEFKRLRWIK